MSIATGNGGPFGVPQNGNGMAFENPDGVGAVNGLEVSHNVYDGKPWPLLTPGDYDNVREVVPERQNSFPK